MIAHAVLPESLPVYPPLPGATPYATVQAASGYSGPIVVRGTCGEPHIHQQRQWPTFGHPSYISAIYIPWIRRSFRVKALTGPARQEDLMATARA
jgi:hypothetical protein